MTPPGRVGWSPSALLLALAVAALVAGTLHASGAYYAIAGGIVGGALVVAAGVLVIAGRQPSTPVAAFAAALVMLGAWSVASTAWGGLPHTALRFFGLLISVAAAAVAGSCLSTSRQGQVAVVGGVGLGIVAHAMIELVAVGTYTAPDTWFEVRYLTGPVGYHNAEGTALVLGLPIAIWAGASRDRYVRAVGAASAGVLVGTMLLTQSRGALVAAIVSVIAQILISRRWRVAALSVALAAVGAALVVPLRHVDRALVAGDYHASEVSSFVAYTFACAILLGALSLPEIRLARRPTRRQGLIVLLAGGAILLIVGAASAAALGNRVDGLLNRLTVEPTSTLVPGGQTRLASVSPTGRLEQWRLAARMASERPVAGYGTGTFSRRWGRDRTIRELYVLQAHSIEMELASELGLVGCAIGLGAAIALALGIARGVGRERAIGAVAAAAALGFLTQASLDWVLSFPAVVAPVAAVAAAASPGAVRAPGVVRTLAYGAAVLVGVFVLSGPALAAFELDRARDAGPARFASAWSSITRARSFNRWDPEVVSYEGILTESAGRFVVAASLYGRAADLSQQPWADWYRQARALRQAGLVRASRDKCRQAIASDPLDRSLPTGVCKDIA